MAEFKLSNFIDNLTGSNGKERYQTWPEKILRSAVELPHDVMTGQLPIVDPATGRTNVEVINRAQDLSALTLTGPLAAERGALGSAGGKLVTKLAEIEAKYPNVKLDVGGGNGKPITLSRIEVPKELRNQGIGTDIMKQLTSVADSEGVSFALTPSKDFGGNINKLKDFYEGFGFKPNKGKNKDFSISESYVRNPEIDPKVLKLKNEGYNIDEPVYHETNTQFNKIKPSFGTQTWFTTDKSTLGENGAAASGKVATVYLKHKKLATREQYEKYSTDELIAQGYDGARLEKDIVMYDPKNVKIHKWDDLNLSPVNHDPFKTTPVDNKPEFK